jgi:phage gp46-like protein
MITQSTLIDSLTHDYIIENYQFKRANILFTLVYTRIMTPLGSYKFNSNFGSQLNLCINQKNVVPAQIIITYLTNALLPLKEHNHLKTFEITINHVSLNLLIFTINIVDIDGTQFPIKLNYPSSF